MADSSKTIADDLGRRVADPSPISVEEFRRLFLKGLAALVRETDAISYNLRQRGQR